MTSAQLKTEIICPDLMHWTILALIHNSCPWNVITVLKVAVNPVFLKCIYLEIHADRLLAFLAYGPLLWPGPFYGHLLYLALPEYSAIPLFLRMRSHAKSNVT